MGATTWRPAGRTSQHDNGTGVPVGLVHRRARDVAGARSLVVHRPVAAHALRRPWTDSRLRSRRERRRRIRGGLAFGRLLASGAADANQAGRRRVFGGSHPRVQGHPRRPDAGHVPGIRRMASTGVDAGIHRRCDRAHDPGRPPLVLRPLQRGVSNQSLSRDRGPDTDDRTDGARGASLVEGCARARDPGGRCPHPRVRHVDRRRGRGVLDDWMAGYLRSWSRGHGDPPCGVLLGSVRPARHSLSAPRRAREWMVAVATRGP